MGGQAELSSLPISTMPVVIAHVTSPDEFEKLKSDAHTAGKALLVDFHAQWCGPCKAIAPKLQAMADEFELSVVVIKVDVDEAEALTQSEIISAMPTFKVFRPGSDKPVVVTGASEPKLRALFDGSAK